MKTESDAHCYSASAIKCYLFCLSTKHNGKHKSLPAIIFFFLFNLFSMQPYTGHTVWREATKLGIAWRNPMGHSFIYDLTSLFDFHSPECHYTNPYLARLEEQLLACINSCQISQGLSQSSWLPASWQLLFVL